MLTFRTLAAGAPSEAAAYAAHLLEKTLPDGEMRLAEYYAGTNGVEEALADGMGAVPTIRADMSPAVGRVLGVRPGQVLDEKQLAMILSGRRADGRDLPGKQRKVGRYQSKQGAKDRFTISGIDLCLSAPKSVSVAWAFAKTAAERNTILQAHRDARDATLRYVEKEVAFGRMGKGGKDGLEPATLAWINIDHFTSRPTIALKRPDPKTEVIGTELYTLNPRLPGDPQLHSHNIVPNVVVTASGRVCAVHRDLIAGRIHEFGATYQAFLAQNLRNAGIEVDLCERTKMAKLPAIPDSICDEFSKRTRDAGAAARSAAKERGLDWDQMSAEQQVKFLKGGAKSSRRYKADDLANFSAWFDQAAGVDWKHDSVVTGRSQTSLQGRINLAFDTAVPLFDEELQKRAVVTGTDARLQAARGLIRAGIASSDDIGAITRKMATEGVRQDGERTDLLWGNGEDGRVKITTTLHRDQEAELVQLAQEAAADCSRALTRDEIDAAVHQTGVTFDGDIGPEQRDVVYRTGTGGALGAFLGNAGSGKTSRILPPLVAAWNARGYTVWGTAQAWRQSDALHDAGIRRFNTRALVPFLQGVESGRTKVDANSVVVIDELSQIGTRQLLVLLRLRKQHGFQIVMAGDDRQGQSITAGPVIELLRQALGLAAIPEVQNTVRQRTDREREIAGLFRDGKPESAVRAIGMKREDGTAEAVDGGYDEAVERIADLAMTRRALTPAGTVTISAPTNADAQAISMAIRARRQAAGEVGPDQVTLEATDGRGAAYRLALAKGDRVRLFARTHATYASGHGGHMGNNGTVLTVARVRDDGLDLVGETGNIGFVPWTALRDEGSGYIRLALGDCLTIDSSQGITSDQHIFAIPAGSRGVQGFKAYVAASRHRSTSWLVTSKGAEMSEVTTRRPLGITEPVTDDDIWKNVSNNLSRQTMKETATAFLVAAADLKGKCARSFQASMRSQESRAAEGKPRTDLTRRAQHRQAAVGLAKAVAAFQPSAERRPRKTIRIDEHDARRQFAEELRRRGFDLRGELPVMDGRWHPAPLVGQTGRSMSGSYIGFGDQWPAGKTHNHKTGEKLNWKAEGESAPMSPAEAAAMEAEAVRKRQARLQECAKAALAGAKQAEAIMRRSRPALADHSYLKRKGIKPDGFRQDGSGIVLPLTDADDVLWNVETIYPDGAKRPIPGARRDGLMHRVGPAVKNGQRFGIAEGMSTAYAVYRALNMTMFSTSSANNLIHVAKALREKFPASPILIAADNDHHLPRRSPALPNVGVEKAKAAAAAVGGDVRVPLFGPDDTGTDWEDYGRQHGQEALRRAVGTATQEMSPAP